jgi:hypothetical protein
MLRIGITGHRWVTGQATVLSGLGQIFDALERIAPPPWVLLSSLAEGADRLVVEQARLRCPTTPLIVPLPLPVEEYCRDFAEPQSQMQFLSLLRSAAQVLPAPVGCSTPQQAYLQAGQVVVLESDLLLAVWDGLPARGMGGTAEVVALARSREHPLAWLHCHSGQVTWERMERLGGGKAANP